MLYGRRFHEIQRKHQPLNANKIILNKAFQYKYTWYLMTAIVGASLLFLIPSYYFVLQNYHIFKALAYDTSPGLVSHLEREVSWLGFFLIASFSILSAITLFLGLRMTKNIIDPLVNMEKHMRQLMLGQWSIEDYKVHDGDDFRDLSMTYEYFYRALKANTEIELKMLEKIIVDPQNREAHAHWKTLIAIKRDRLGIKDVVIVNDEAKNEPPQLRRVS